MDYDIEDRRGAAEDLAPISQGGSGQLVTITTPFAGVFDPATQTSTTGSPTTQIGSGVEEEYSAFSLAGGLALAGDKKFILSALVFAADGSITDTALTKPVPDRDTCTLANGSVWTIKKVDTLAPAGLAIMFTLQMRGV